MIQERGMTGWVGRVTQQCSGEIHQNSFERKYLLRENS